MMVDWKLKLGRGHGFTKLRLVVGLISLVCEVKKQDNRILNRTKDFDSYLNFIGDNASGIG